MNKERPFFRFPLADLHELQTQNISNRKVLRDISAELKNRTTPGAKKMKQEVDHRLSQLNVSPTAAARPLMSRSISDLEEIYQNDQLKDDLEVLRHELSFRKTARAVRLLQELDKP